MTTSQLELNDFLKKFYNPDTQKVEVPESQQQKLIFLIADTLPEDQQDQFIIEKDYTRLWNMLNDAHFDSDYHKEQLFQNLFEHKITDYKFALAMDYIKDKLNLSTEDYNSLIDKFTDQASKIALENDEKECDELQADLNQYLIDHFQDAFGFDPSNAGGLNNC